MYPWSVPDEIVCFIYNELDRFKEHPPTEKSINCIADFVLSYVANKRYYPRHHTEAVERYSNTPGLTEPEKFELLGPLEYLLKIQLKEKITFDQLHLVAWASLMFCWSLEGEIYVVWYRRTYA